ncbi:HAD family hydrolase [Paenibacillus sp. 1P07SE]|uniref:HAD family hydrolase n=1 Tax=Paenibacillus sp. 1P07SE TaxID=3132209 RepID=UPI0039A7025A
MKDIKLIVCDVDGTLLSAQNELSEQVAHTIRNYVSGGGLFTVATGRPQLTARRIVRQLSLTAPYILCNGSVIAQGDRLLARDTIGLEELAPMLEEADRRGLTVLLFEDERVRTLRRTAEVEAFEAKERVACELVDAAEDWRSGRVLKVILIGDLVLASTLWEPVTGMLGGRYDAVQSEHHYLEIIPGGHSKGKALARVLEELELEPGQVMAIGNQLNDLDMLEHAGIGVAVGNSHPLLKDQADYVCSGSYGEGVVEAISTFCSITEQKEG